MSAAPSPGMMPARRVEHPCTPPRRPLRAVPAPRPTQARIEPSVGRLPSYTPESRHPSGPCTRGCGCQVFTWDLRPYILPTDPPRSCECGCPATNHKTTRRFA